MKSTESLDLVVEEEMDFKGGDNGGNREAGNGWGNVDKILLESGSKEEEEEVREEEGEGAKEDESTHNKNNDNDDKEVIRGEPAFLFYSMILWTTRSAGSVAPSAGIVSE
jgi:hypothetical protein